MNISITYIHAGQQTQLDLQHGACTWIENLITSMHLVYRYVPVSTFVEVSICEN